MWKNSFKNVQSDNNKILYKTLLEFFSNETVLTFWISLVYSPLPSLWWHVVERRDMWPIQLAFFLLLFVAYLCLSCLFVILLHFCQSCLFVIVIHFCLWNTLKYFFISHMISSTNLLRPSPAPHFQTFHVFWSAFKNDQSQHLTQLCSQFSTLPVSSLNLSPVCWWKEPSVECCLCLIHTQ